MFCAVAANAMHSNENITTLNFSLLIMPVPDSCGRFRARAGRGFVENHFRDIQQLTP
jgi:hypothetical protein